MKLSCHFLHENHVTERDSQPTEVSQQRNCSSASTIWYYQFYYITKSSLNFLSFWIHWKLSTPALKSKMEDLGICNLALKWCTCKVLPLQTQANFTITPGRSDPDQLKRSAPQRLVQGPILLTCIYTAIHLIHLSLKRAIIYNLMTHNSNRLRSMEFWGNNRANQILYKLVRQLDV